MDSKVENQRSHIAALHEKLKESEDESSDSESDGEEEGISNRIHPDVSRQKKKNKKVKVSLKYGNFSLVEGTGGGGALTFSTFYTMRIKVANSSINSDKTRWGLDSHLDTTVLGKGCLVVHYFYRPANVTGYDPDYVSKVSCTVTGVLDYYHPHNGKPYFLVIDQDTHLDHLGNNLMCTMNYRKNGIKINDTPNYHSKTPDESTHTFQVEDPSD